MCFRNHECSPSSGAIFIGSTEKEVCYNDIFATDDIGHILNIYIESRFNTSEHRKREPTLPF
ncbi:hypothetical protein GCM10008014_05990 [Paenibacillus silvae]|uniref:Uncharacterized protein n=1 Tax=Paenibacillus silvae TaxID=1325358 RepID=A0ABQ1YZG1_9BACL|nr:hypothetical protein GCM10008014_05990 [Paenibacillus silvae]